ncbi:ABC transporter ATP-binding protein [uncultured Microbulbifer sp.]|uniref:ABC transporter ATP-binding protein n=1 Tax=uncultured Microbulbifer sp. TaxID=348147 RepID=UPI0026194EEB|nr:ABC transporter ATP-binding protein [uncultured Microbulbifer sp.]
MSNTLIQFRAITKQYHMGDTLVHALAGVDLDILRNDYVAVTGPSGSGKSTLMNLLGCLDQPTSGEYFLSGKLVSARSGHELAVIRNRKIGFVFQTFNLLSRHTALQNVMQPLVYRQVKLPQRRAMAEKALERVGLGGRMEHLPNQMSGGQRQRVAIARALVGSPSLLIADEPTGNLDSITTQEIMGLFAQLHSEGNTIVMVTHELEIAACCQRTIRLEDGKVIADDRQAQAGWEMGLCCLG